MYAGGRQTIRNVKYPLRHFANAIALLALLFVAAGSAYADNAPLCAPGNLASLIVTTCDIGEFQYTFTAVLYPVTDVFLFSTFGAAIASTSVSGFAAPAPEPS